MDVNEFREKVSPKSTIIIKGERYAIRELVKFRFDDGSYYIKCYLNDGWVFADDDNENMYLLVRPAQTPFERPFPEKIEFDNKKFDFLYDAHATAEEVSSEDFFKKGESESFWDYTAKDGSYLSLGIGDEDGKRADFYGHIVRPEEISLE